MAEEGVPLENISGGTQLEKAGKSVQRGMPSVGKWGGEMAEEGVPLENICGGDRVTACHGPAKSSQAEQTSTWVVRGAAADTVERLLCGLAHDGLELGEQLVGGGRRRRESRASRRKGGARG